MSLRSRWIGGLSLLMALLFTGCAEEIMITPTPIVYFTPAPPLAIAEVAGIDATPTPAGADGEAATLGAPQTTAVALATVEMDPPQPLLIALATVELDTPQPPVIALATVTLGETQADGEHLPMTDLTVIVPEPRPLVVTELEIIVTDGEGASAVVGGEAGADQLALPSAAQTDEFGALIEASALTSLEVVNVDAQRLGALDDLIVDLANGQLLFATLRYGGLLNLNLGERTLPIPPAALSSAAAQEQLRLALNDAALARMDGFGYRWPQLDRTEWEAETRSSWRSVDRTLVANTAITNASVTPEALRRASELRGEPVYDVTGDELARVDNLLIALESGSISYLVVEQGGWLGLGGDQFAIPFSAFEFAVLDDEDEAMVILDAHPDDFANAPVFDRAVIDLDDPQWRAPVDAYWLRADPAPGTP